MQETLTCRLMAGGYKLECQRSATAIRLDTQGRWCSFRQGAAFYRRCLDSTLVQGDGTVTLPPQQALAVYNRVRHWLGEQAAQVEEPSLQALLVKASHYQFGDYQELARRYQQTYLEPVPILPPDRYRDCVVQPALGCPNRRCTFCAFYKDRPFAVIRPSDLARHMTAVAALLGREEISARGGIFIGSANAMALSQRRLLICLDQIDGLAGALPRGIAAFADPDFSAPRTAADWRTLAGRNVQRLVIGLETGWGALRARLGKAGDLSRVRQAVVAMKTAGIPVGLTVLAGVCDDRRHFQQTRRFLQSLELAPMDRVYISLLNESSVATALACQEKAQWLTGLKAHLQAQVVPYQIQRFHYYA